MLPRFAPLILLIILAPIGHSAEPNPYAVRAREVTEYIDKHLYDEKSGVYFRSLKERRPDYTWLQGVMFSNLTAAARIEPKTYAPRLHKYFVALEAYWDAKTKIPGYEAAPTRGNGNDKYYDDNAWMVITFLEAHETNKDVQYLKCAEETLAFVLSGWDDQLGGGIWWHQHHKDGTKNACSNGPAAVGCLRLARCYERTRADEMVAWAEKIVAWTVTHLQDKDALFDDRQVVATGEVKRGKLTYNSALMLRAMLGLYRATGKKEHLEQAQRIGKAADWFLNKDGLYRDQVRYSHFMIEADLELYRATQEAYHLARAKKNVDALYERWKQKPPEDLISNAAIGRVLWLMSETETAVGQAFWRASDQTKK